MTNQELIVQLSQLLGQTEERLLVWMDATMDWMSESLVEGVQISLPHFGVLSTQKKTEYISENHLTNERFLVPPRLVPTFVADKKILEEQPHACKYAFASDLAARTGESAKEITVFLNKLFAVVAEYILKDGEVEVDNLATFKLLPILDDKNAAVKRFRLLFFPSESLQEYVNKPFAHFEETPINEGVVFENIPTILAEKKTLDTSETLLEMREPEVPVVLETPSAEALPEPAAEALPEPDPEVATVVVPARGEGPEDPPVLLKRHYPLREKTNNRDQKTKVLTLITLGGIVVAIAAAAFFFQNRKSHRA